MIHCFIISTSEKFIEESKQFIEKNTYVKQITIKLKDKEDYQESSSIFQYIASFFSSISPADLRESVVIVDEYFDLKNAKPIEINSNCDNFYARLILGFPELEFIFLNATENGTKSIIDWAEKAKIIANENKSYVSIFDYTGIRNTIRKNIKTFNNQNISILPVRSKKARIIEDELSYAFFHGYITYKRNHLSKIYTTLNHLEQEKSQNNFKPVNLQVQDLSLGFIDKRADNHISDIAKRYEEFPYLDINNGNDFQNNDFFITVGNGTTNAEKSSLEINKVSYEIINKANDKRAYLVLQAKGEKEHYIFTNAENDTNAKMCSICGMKISSPDKLIKKAKVLYKPTKGIYDIEGKLALGDWPSYNPDRSSSNLHKVRGEVKNGKSDTPNTDDDEIYSNHSAAGILTFLAEQLISRAQNILDSAKNVIDAIHAATLALEAKELLNGLTPTLGLQAFALQQKAEVTAECLFTGTEYNIKLNERFDDINHEVGYIVQQFSAELRKKALLNTQLSIIESLSGIYSNHRQFEEEVACLNKALKLSLNLMSIKDFKWKYIFKAVITPLDSVRNFATLIFWLQILFGWIYFIFLKLPIKNLTPSTNLNDWDWERDAKMFLESFISAAKYFFTSDTSKQFEPIFAKYEPYSTVLLGFQGFCTLTSVSILMALVYLRISRK